MGKLRFFDNNMMCRLLCALFIICFSSAQFVSFSQNNNAIYISGKVKEAIGKTDLPKAYILKLDDDGNPTDTIHANMGGKFQDGEIIETSRYYIELPRVDSTYIFRVECEGYAPFNLTYTIDNIGKREMGREVPDIYLERAPIRLNEVTVTTSKIKFYNKGDTIVYNADAFLLAEGSMLDALIAQLPGVELSDNGQIKVNGQFVESLLLNGKDFFDGDNNLMLDNIAAYTVKNIQVYEGESKQATRELNNNLPKVLTMDVKLKKEYNGGFILNAQGGYGTEDRYLGRLFASWFRNRSRVSVIANANNLNDNRKPGRNDSWTPEQMPNGIRKTYMAGIDYNHESGDEKFRASGNVAFRHVNNHNLLTNDRINFLPGGDTYENSFADARNRETFVSLQNDLYFKDVAPGLQLSNYICGDYSDTRNSSSQVAGSFNEEQPGITAEILDAIYSDGSQEQLENIINRSRTRTDSRVKSYYGCISQSIGYTLPKSGDGFRAYLVAHYKSNKNYAWNDYDINFGRNPADVERRRQYTDNTPNHLFRLNGVFGFFSHVQHVTYSINYEYNFEDLVRDSYMYALDRLNDMGVYGVLPEGYESTFMPGWSSTSRTLSNTHSLRPTANYTNKFEKSYINVMFFPILSFKHRNYNFNREGLDHHLSTDNVTLNINPEYGARIDYRFGPKDPNDKWTDYRNTFLFKFGSRPTLPDLFDMIDVVNDADPINVYQGNPDLKPEVTYSYQLEWRYKPFSHSLHNKMLLHYSYKDNALIRGYSYDTATGVHYNRTYNVDGNWSAQLHDDIIYQFGAKKQFTITNSAQFVMSGYSDMIGVNKIEPELMKVRHLSLTDNMRFSWQIGAQQLSVRCDFTRRNTTSEQPGFNDIHANHFNYGLSGLFKLPAGLSISTDFVCYTRRGYGSKQLDTTDPVWNLRLSYAPTGNSHWVFMADAFDLLHKLSNVNYAVTASGRTVSYTNALPRYVLISAQYRFSIQPPK